MAVAVILEAGIFLHSHEVFSLVEKANSQDRLQESEVSITRKEWYSHLTCSRLAVLLLCDKVEQKSIGQFHPMALVQIRLICSWVNLFSL